MDETVDRGLQRDESAEGNDADDFALNDGTDRILLIRIGPGLRLKLLITERHALFLCINIQDEDFDLLADGQHVGGMLHAAPRNIGHMHETVDAADVNKRTEIRDAANNALHLAADNQLRPLGALCLGLLRKQNLLLRSHDTLTLFVYFENLELHGLANELVQILGILDGNLRCRHESANAVDVRNEAALDDFLADCLKDLALDFAFAHELIPNLLAFYVLAREEHVALAVVDLENLDFNLVALFEQICGIHVCVARKLILRNDAVGLVADIHEDFAVHDLQHGARNQLTVVNTGQGLLKGLREIGRLVGCRRLCGLFFGGFYRCGCFCHDGFLILGGFRCDDLLGGSFRFDGFNRRLFQFAHYLYNLPNHPVRRRCARNNSYYIIGLQIIKKKFADILYGFCMFTFLFANFLQTDGICTHF